MFRIYCSLIFLEAKAQYCANFMQLASAFGEASGLSINIQKSSLFFSPNTPMEKWQEIRAVLRMGDMDTKAKYLGLPTLWEGSKKESMSFIRDNIMRKIRGWKGSQTNQAEKEVLINQFYKVSLCTSLCVLKSQLLSLANFGGVRGMVTGAFIWGLGRRCQFQDFAAFNSALLAKQVWRMIKSPSSFWVEVLKGLYFPDW